MQVDQERTRPMPLIQVSLAKGRSSEQLQALGEALTAAVEETIGARRETIRVVLTECEPDHWFVGGETLADLRAADTR
ncbi:2-hydroxymuconate tautomerase [Streptomyces sp. NPDC002143]